MRYHYVYEVQNVINGKIYIGKHSTDDLDDGYMGSGVLLTAAIAKHGIENFRKRIIKFFTLENDALEFEKEIVNEAFVAKQSNYNVALGGGGFDSKTAGMGGSKSLTNRWNDPVWRASKLKSISHHSKLKASEQNRRMHAMGILRSPNWSGRKHRDETRAKIGRSNSASQSGERNSQYGTAWIFDPAQNVAKKVSKEEVESYLMKGWRKGRK